MENTIWLGDCNWHHPIWDEECNHQLFTAANLDTAQKLINMLTSHNMTMILPMGMPKLEATNLKNYTRPDNVFCNSEFGDNFTACTTDPKSHSP